MSTFSKRGFSFWPARKTGEFNGKTWVKFYGTNDLGTVPKNNWIGFSDSAFQRLVTEKNLKRKIFHRAVSELLHVLCSLCIVKNDSSLFDLIGESYHQAQHVRTHPPVGAGSQDGDTEAGPLQEPPHQLTSPPQISSITEGTAVQARETAEVSAAEARDTAEGSVVEVRDTSEGSTAEARGTAENSVKVKDVSNVTKNLKKRTLEQNKNSSKRVRKTLREDQKEVNQKFHEKITKQNPGYTCKLCKFSTGILLKAKTHAVSCGTVKRKSKIKKEIRCVECEQMFTNKKESIKHFRSTHQKNSYKCSKCSKSYKKLKSYTLHLKNHDTEFSRKFKCNLCSYKTRDSWLLKRHKTNNHTNQVYALSSKIIFEILDSLSREEQSVITGVIDPANDINSVDDLDLENSNTVEHDRFIEVQEIDDTNVDEFIAVNDVNNNEIENNDSKRVDNDDELQTIIDRNYDHSTNEDELNQMN